MYSPKASLFYSKKKKKEGKTEKTAKKGHQSSLGRWMDDRCG